MRIKATVSGSFGIAMVVLFSIVFFTLAEKAEAKSKVVAIEGMSYNVNFTMADNLKTLIGKKVSITTISGKVISGKVKKVGIHLVHLEKLEGKGYYDALVRIDKINAIDARFRDFQR